MNNNTIPIKLLVEVQASYVGVGKSTFTKIHLPYPRIDDCINMIESDPDLFANANNLAAHLVIENYAATLDVVASQYHPSWIIVASRSPLISAVQFSNKYVDWKGLERYYRKRLEHLGVDHVLILDYGTSIQQDPFHVKNAFEQMHKRGRIFELERYFTLEAYSDFFYEGEQRKRDVIEMLDPTFFTYKAMSFNGFGKRDGRMANKAIRDCQTKVNENKQLQMVVLRTLYLDETESSEEKESN